MNINGHEVPVEGIRLTEIANDLWIGVESFRGKLQDADQFTGAERFQRATKVAGKIVGAIGRRDYRMTALLLDDPFLKGLPANRYLQRHMDDLRSLMSGQVPKNFTGANFAPTD